MFFKLKSGAQKTESSVEEQSRAGIIADFGKQRGLLHLKDRMYDRGEFRFLRTMQSAVCVFRLLNRLADPEFDCITEFLTCHLVDVAAEVRGKRFKLIGGDTGQSKQLVVG